MVARPRVEITNLAREGQAIVRLADSPMASGLRGHICSSPAAAGRASRRSTSRPPGSRRAQRESLSMRGCARPTGASLPSATSRVARSSPTSPATTPGTVIRSALFRPPAKIDYRALPWVTYTDPELAQVELTEAAARVAGVGVRVLRWPFVENDRAQHEKEKYVQGMLICTATVAASASARSSLCDRNRRRPLAGSCSSDDVRRNCPPG